MQILTIFPNYSAKYTNGQLYLESSQVFVNEPLAAEGFGIQIATTVHSGHFDGNYAPVAQTFLQFTTLGAVDASLSKCKRGLRYFRYLWPIANTVRKSQFCYIYAPGHTGLVASILCWLLGKPYGLYLRCEWRDATPTLLRWMRPMLFRKACFVLCTGHSLAGEVRRINPHTEAVVPMSHVLFLPDYQLSNHKGNTSITLLFVGQMLRTKGIFELLEAVDILRQRGINQLQLIMAGNGADKAEFKKAMQKQNLEDRIRCLGFVSDPTALATLYQSSDLFCLPTYYQEGFPRVLYEAMRFYLPIVTTAAGQIASIIVNGHNGVFCTPKDALNLADILQALIEQPEQRKQIGMAGRKTLEPLMAQWSNQTHGHQIVSWIKKCPCV